MLRGRNSLISLIALMIILYFVALPLVFAVLCGIFGSAEGVILKVVEIFPFGEGILHLALSIASAIGGQVVSFPETQGYLTFSYVLGELAKGIFTIIIFELLNLLLYMVLGLTDGTGRWNGLKKTCVTVFDALLAACLAPLPIQFAMDQISILMANGQGLRQIAGNIISCIVYAVVAGGAIVFLYVVLGFTLAKAIAFILGKVVLIDFVRLLVSYTCILLILLFWYSGNYGMLIPACCGLLGISLLLAGIDLVISPLLEP